MKKQFLAERVRALATIVLTRRTDLTLTEAKPGRGLDLQIHINRDDWPMRPTLGVLLRGAFPPTTADAANKALVPTLNDFRRRGKYTVPVCLFYFTMRDDRGYFSWLAEPVVAKDGSPKLVQRKKADCVELTNEMPGQVLDRVVAWYDALEVVLTAE
jgi:hypothetical protein